MERSAVSRSLLGFYLCLSLCACATPEHWVGVPVGIAKDDANAMNEPSNLNPGLAMNNAKLTEAGVSVGERSKQFFGIFRTRLEAYALFSKSTRTADAVGEFTGNVNQSVFGLNMGGYITDYFYWYINPFPYMNYVYTNGTKIRPNPGRTTDLGRTWDSGFSAGAGLEFKLLKTFSLGIEWRDVSTIKKSMTVDSAGFAYDNHYYGLIAKFWY